MSQNYRENIYASLAAQEKRIAKAKLDSEEKSVLGESERSVQVWADDERRALARRHERETESLKKRFQMEREELENKIQRRKVIR